MKLTSRENRESGKLPGMRWPPDRSRRVAFLAAVDLALERNGFLRRPEAVDREAAGAASAFIGNQRIGGAVHHEHRHRLRRLAGIRELVGEIMITLAAAANRSARLQASVMVMALPLERPVT